MQEPLPQLVKPPIAEEILRVGLVLEEDLRSQLSITASNSDYSFVSAEQVAALLPRQTYTLKSRGDNLEVEGGALKASFKGPLRINNKNSRLLSSDNGLQLEPMLVGRGFHWRHELPLVFPGEFEIISTDSGLIVVNLVSFEDYICCVVSSEMNKECPSDFVKAQAVAARSWALCFLKNKHPGRPYSICNDDDCQRYQGLSFSSAESIKAVKECRAEFLLGPQNWVVPAYYSKSCGGHTELPQNSLGIEVPVLSAVVDSRSQTLNLDLRRDEHLKKWLDSEGAFHKDVYCSSAKVAPDTLGKYLGAVDTRGEYYRWQVELTMDELENLLRQRLGLEDLDKVKSLIISSRGVSGRALILKVLYQTSRGKDALHSIEGQYEIRRCLHPSFLFSSAINIEMENSSPKRMLRIRGAGWGHGVGLCQIGALGMALDKLPYTKILAHYFPLARLYKAKY